MSDYLFYMLPAVLGGYALSSLLLLKKPLLLHSKKNFPPVRLIAHRGGAGEGIENTLENYKRSLSFGCQMLELDVHLTKDQQVVVVHDNSLLRLTGMNFLATETAYADLPTIQDKIWIDFQPGELYDAAQESDRKLPLLDSVLELFKQAQINIDIKDKSQQLVDEVDTIIRRHNSQSRCVWGSFSGETTDMCFKKNPNIGLLFSAPRIVGLLFLFYTGLLPFFPLRETHLEIPMPSIFLSEKYQIKGNTVGLAKLPRWFLILCDYVLMSPVLFKHLEQRGISTYLWVLNSQDEYSRALDLGATGIMTDYPSKLKAFVDQNCKID